MPERIFASSACRFMATITDDAVREMSRLANRAGENETGGVLIGSYSLDLCRARVERVTGGGDDARAGRWWFVRGVLGLQSLLDRLWRDRSAYYLGEWHYHPGADPRPSPQDVRQMREIARSAQYNCPEPILFILGGGLGKPWKVHIEVFQRSGERHVLRPVADGSQVANPIWVTANEIGDASDSP